MVVFGLSKNILFKSILGPCVHYLNKWKADKSLWEFYNESLPFPLTPARGKGKHFISEIRRKAKMDEDFISRMSDYSDSFRVTKRKEWS